MKTQQFLQSLTQKWQQWQQRYKNVSSPNNKEYDQAHKKTVIKNILLHLSSTNNKSGSRSAKIKSGIDRLANNQVLKKRPAATIILGWVYEKRSSMILVMTVASLTGVVGHKLYNQPQLKVGTPAPQTFRAPRTARIEDRKQTEANRKAVSKDSGAVLMVDGKRNEQINEDISKLLDDIDKIRQVAGSFPFFDSTALSIYTQRYLRSCPDLEWQHLLVVLENARTQKPDVWTFQARGREAGKNLPKLPPLGSLNYEFTQAVGEIEAYRITTSDKNLSLLIEQISQARKEYNQAATKLVQMEAIKPEAVYEETFVLDLSEDHWEKTQRGIDQILERILTQGIPEGLPNNILEDAVRLQVQTFVPGEAELLATKILMSVLKPNLKLDQEQTQKQAQQAADGVPAVMVDVRQGEVIVSKGKLINSWNFDVLEHYQLIRREVNWLDLGKLAGFFTVAAGVFVWVERHFGYSLRQRDRLLVLLLTLSTPGIIAVGIPYATWSAVGLLLGSFYGPAIGVTVVGMLSIILPITADISKIWLFAGAGGGILGSCIAHKLRSREELALLGAAIGLMQGCIYLILKVLVGAAFGSMWYVVLQEGALVALSGLAWSIVALGLSPYLEKLFDLITPIRLAELANPNRPLLKRLATETPGTFQHTLFVATLAEAAAKELGCNVELVRAGTLYHDIGKMHDPLGFIENQMGGPNKHDTEIKDPWQSAEIIRKHVTEGLVMAKRHRLPTAIQAFIPEHQGTMAIAYFYHQALEMAKEDPSIIVDEADFRYVGPIPQSRETGIVMLADSSEAALRSLKDATPEKALKMLNNILRGKWQDGQLEDSGLTREDMSQIAQIFVDVWQQFHHKRIAYPKSKV
ncbi:HD family phosphohydrolase [Cronbergia sp. UHCC 0137]|uniref:HD family phosphohydrolase n=1 Tax=Cronbergia sp. UHCC 0137 TaxID=3110239 RepID=UPI002B1F9CF3|nr:HD family phosphohydrolase [Cronbergia sp. UHCC 0137]MEA5616929.1 HD family phosphohydrolase [Cronbergia sp. UHCC 0137]